MLEPAAAPKSKAWLLSLLHDLSQPLTALECRLHIGTMEDPGGEKGAEVLREALTDALVQCQRLMGQMRAAQEELAREP